MKAVIVGGGVGGLAAAVALRSAGHEAEVIERATVPAEVGAGLSLAPNALAALDRLGLGRRREGARRCGAMDPRPQPTRRRPQRDRRAGTGVGGGRRAPRRSPGRAPIGSVVRAGPVRSNLRRLRRDRDRRRRAPLRRVECRRRGPHRRRRSPLDHSRAAEGRRATSLRRVLRLARRHRLRGPVRRRDVQRVVGAAAARRLVTIGHGRLYWFVSELGPERMPLPQDAEAYLAERLRDWHDPIPAVAAATPPDALTRLPIHDRPPADGWGRDRVTLLGDAAHPMTPNLGQGAAQALEDAVILADALRTADDPLAALRDYEHRRIPRTTMIVRRSWQLGRIAHLRNPLACRIRDAFVKTTPQAVQRRQQEAVIRF